MESKSEKISRLKLLIKQTKENIKLKSDEVLKISEKLKLKESEIKDTKKFLEKFSQPKIFTKKELDNLRKEEAENRKKQIQDERMNIDSETKKALSEAKKIRLESLEKSEEEKLKANFLAKDIEIKALSKEIKIFNEILDEKNLVFEDLLAQSICNKFSGLNKKVKNTHLKPVWLELKKEIDELSLKIKNSTNKLKSCIEKQ